MKPKNSSHLKHRPFFFHSHKSITSAGPWINAMRLDSAKKKQGVLLGHLMVFVIKESRKKSILDANLESLRIFTEKDIWKDTSFSSFSVLLHLLLAQGISLEHLLDQKFHFFQTIPNKNFREQNLFAQGTSPLQWRWRWHFNIASICID